MRGRRTPGKKRDSSSSEKVASHLDSLDIKQQAHSKQKRERDAFGQEMVEKKISRSSSVSFHKKTDSEHEKSDAENYDTVLSKNDKLRDLPTPPACGTLGKKVDLRVNCFRVHCKTKRISQYTLEFDPPLPTDSHVFKQRLINENYAEIKNALGVFLFDKMLLWSLNKVVDSIVIQSQEHKMTISYIKSVNLKNAPYDEFNQIIHIIFQKATANSCLVKIGRNHYDKNKLNDENLCLTRDSIRLFRGYSMTIEQTSNGLQLTVDISHRVIKIGSVAAQIDEMDENFTPTAGKTAYSSADSADHRSYGVTPPDANSPRPNSKELMRRCEEELVGRCVITTYRMRNWRIDEIDWSQNIDSTFTWRKKSGETAEISFRDYFFENYRLKLYNKRHGLLVNLPKRRAGGKGPDRFLLPPETCYMTGLSQKMKADFGLMKRIRDAVSLTPPQRFRGIEDVVKLLSDPAGASSSNESGSSSGESEERREADMAIHVERGALKVQGRVLADVNVRLDMEGRPMEAKAKDLMRHWARLGCVNKSQHRVERWVVFHESRYDRQANQLANELIQNSAKYRMLDQPMDVIEVRANPKGRGVFEAWRDAIANFVKKVSTVQLIVVLIPSHFKSDDVYSAVKSATLMDPKRLIPSQCIKAQRFDQRNSRSLRSVIGSTLKQILTKRGNVPWIVNFDIKGRFNPFDGKTMLCGIDINHDIKRDRSTAGFCVSGDSRFSRYDTYVSIGPVGSENLVGAEKCIVKSLLSFHKENGHLPQHVVVYRDGVSNSELTRLVETEIKSFRDGFGHAEVLKRAAGPYAPKLTFVVVQKRVSMRIFSERLESAAPGTVIDNAIVSSRFWDFYMLTTSPPPGKTSRPTRYVVVYDDYGVTNDEIQSFTNQLCHTYYNFPGPIRVPAPCQIAHQVAYLYGSIISEPAHQLLFTPKCKYKAYYL